MIFVYWRYTDFSHTMLAERGELYGTKFTAIAADHF